MLQILIWAVCILIIGVGYCAIYLEKITAGERATKTTGLAFFVLMLIFAVALFVLSVMQGIQIEGLVGK
ncbi:MAG: hypothetical protein MIO92_03075 [Methanosarcinaceae archaeon]|nr:hypothetical protein [Methanosarcinaceae archaeon]